MPVYVVVLVKNFKNKLSLTVNFKAYDKSGAPLYYVKFNTKTNALGVKTAPKGVVVTIFSAIWSLGDNARLSGIC